MRKLITLTCILLAFAAAPAARAATVMSFDGTLIHVNFFPAAGLAAGHRAPTVLVGPGWGSSGDTNPNSSPDPSTGYPGLGPLRHAGFNVLTWDPRGFGASGGQAEVDSPQFEGRDVSAIISWLANQPQAQLDSPGDPRVGMAGGSYGGGIQLVTAAIDHRVDAIVPDIAWHSLTTSLYKSQTVKLGWSGLLYLAALAAHAHLDPLIGQSYQAGAAGQPLSAQEVGFFSSRGPGNLVRKIHVPTLLVQGTVDTLFTLQEAVDNYRMLKAGGVPVHMLWFCGGHGVCLTNPGHTGLIVHDTLAWLERYLKRNRHVSTGPGFEFVDQRGGEHTAARYPLAAGPKITGRKSGGKLTVDGTGGAGPLPAQSSGSTLQRVVAPITPARASNAVSLRLPAARRTTLVVGAPTLTITYRGTAGTGPAGTRLYAQLIDDATGKVLGNQITPVPVRLDGSSHTLTLPLEIVAAVERRGERFTLQLTPSTVAYQHQLTTGTISFSRIVIVLPTAAG